MYTIDVCLRIDHRIVVARHKYASAPLAIRGRMTLLEDWKKKCKLGIVVSAPIPPQ